MDGAASPKRWFLIAGCLGVVVALVMTLLLDSGGCRDGSVDRQDFLDRTLGIVGNEEVAVCVHRDSSGTSDATDQRFCHTAECGVCIVSVGYISR